MLPCHVCGFAITTLCLEKLRRIASLVKSRIAFQSEPRGNLAPLASARSLATSLGSCSRPRQFINISQPFGVNRAFLWMFLRSHCRSLVVAQLQLVRMEMSEQPCEGHIKRLSQHHKFTLPGYAFVLEVFLPVSTPTVPFQAGFQTGRGRTGTAQSRAWASLTIGVVDCDPLH